MSTPQPPQGPPPGWWQASDGNWYPPEMHPSAQPTQVIGAVSATGGPEPRPWWKRKRVLIPAAAFGVLLALSAAGVGQEEEPDREVETVVPASTGLASSTTTPAPTTAVPTTTTTAASMTTTRPTTTTPATTTLAPTTVATTVPATTVPASTAAPTTMAPPTTRAVPTTTQAPSTTTTAPPTTRTLATTTTTAPTATEPYYANCDAVRAAGATPIRRGDPGFRSGLDRDGDGQACGQDT